MSTNMAWLLLVVARLFEIVWSISMKASHGFTKPLLTAITLVAAGLSFWILGLALRQLPVGTAYAAWTGIGVVGATIFGILFFHEPVTMTRITCIALIIIGIVGLKVFSGTTSA